ncbi:MAG: gliding motility-associated C-terminal domain-containing protein [Bacteroidia bacterium]|jgi:gliding motility-associated-like protein|nr:gliding motility-associated C-terminal domain-containing protein [Bacteroidia bacterium]
MKTLYFVFCLVLFTNPAFGQLTNIWRFGNGAGLDFNSSPVSTLPAGPMNTFEPAATICDNQGSLLFYTNGVDVWDRNNNVMPNGSGLIAGNSTTQCLIVPKPGNCNRYYIFHSGDHQVANDLYYTEVDLCLNNGLGDVIPSSKNVLLTQSCSEKMTAVKHANGIDIWVITHQLNSTAFHSYLVTATGVAAPVISNIGSFHASNCLIGYMKASKTTNKLVVANSFCSLLEMFDINTANGQITNFIDLIPVLSSDWYYGIEFSPNDQILYLSTFWITSKLIQYDLVSGQITQLATTPGNYSFGGLQLGPDGKIYMARTNQAFIDVINSPNIVGPGAMYSSPGVSLPSGTTSQLGLINFVPYLIDEETLFSFSLGNDTSIICNTPVQISGPSVCNSTYNWSNNLPGQPSVSINSAGTYWLTISNTCGTYSDTINISVILTGTNQIQYNQPDTICPGTYTTINLTGMDTYTWLTPPVSQSANGDMAVLSPSASTLYTVVGNSICSSDTAYIMIDVFPAMSLSVNGVTHLCESDSTILTATGGFANYQWSLTSPYQNINDSTILISNVSDSTLISVIANSVCSADTANSVIYSISDVSSEFQLAQDNCTGLILFIPDSSSIINPLWDFGDGNLSYANTPTHVYSQPGSYQVTFINGYNSSCADTSSYTINIDYDGNSPPFYIPNSFTPNNDGLNDLFCIYSDSECLTGTFEIYNRWGELIFSTNNIKYECWDGRYAGKIVENGTYVCQIKLLTGKSIIRHVNVIR